MVTSIELDRIATEIKQSKKYAGLSVETIRRVVEWSALRFAKPKEIDGASRKKLHQIYGAYLEGNTKSLFDEQKNSTFLNITSENVRQYLGKLLLRHSSTKERFSFIGDFYRQIKDKTGTPERIIDIGCGLNPLSYPWLQDAFGQIPYIGYDLDTESTAAMNELLDSMALPVSVRYNDVFTGLPEHTAGDMLFLLKVLPCFEQQENNISTKLLQSIKSHTFVVSFPSLSLGGKDKGMKDHYHHFLTSIISETEFRMEFIDFPNERIYIIKRSDEKS